MLPSLLLAVPGRRAPRAWAASLVMIACSLAMGNCYSPEIDECSISCGEGNVCPDGAHCDHGFCTTGTSSCEHASGGSGGSGAQGSGAQSSGGQGTGALGTGAMSSGGVPENTGGIAAGGEGATTAQGGGDGDSCEVGECFSPPSCAELPSCGERSCCESVHIAGGVFELGRGTQGPDAFASGLADEVPEHLAYVSEFWLDSFETTVGRFRRFVDAYTGEPPAAGAGAHPHLPGSGWSSSWNSQLPKDRQALEVALSCDGASPVGSLEGTFTAEPGALDEKPIVCIDWYVAFAFCVWDGGRLPTETEWEFVAAGGTDDRLFPWGTSNIDVEHASYLCIEDGISGCSANDLLRVGSLPKGRGRWGHEDLAGNAWEWVLDWEGSYSQAAGCEGKDCANLVNQTGWRMTRGGGFLHQPQYLRIAHRGGAGPEFKFWDLGVRCARDR